MTKGSVTANREAILPVTIYDAANHAIEVSAVVDTGFTDYLLLPTHLVTTLGLSFRESCVCELADGTITSLDTYDARIQWLGKDISVFALQADGGPLVGMSLLYGSVLTMEVVDGGMVTVSPLP